MEIIFLISQLAFVSKAFLRHFCLFCFTSSHWEKDNREVSLSSGRKENWKCFKMRREWKLSDSNPWNFGENAELLVCDDGWITFFARHQQNQLINDCIAQRSDQHLSDNFIGLKSLLRSLTVCHIYANELETFYCRIRHSFNSFNAWLTRRCLLGSYSPGEQFEFWLIFYL